MSGDAWAIRPYRSGDENGIAELFARVFKKPISTAHWLWKLRSYELPFENVWLAFDGEKVISQYAGVPVRVFTAGQVQWAVLSVDTMVDPDYRRRGLLTAMAQHAYGQWRASGAAFVYGLPNEKAGPALDPVGLKYAFPLRWRRCHLQPFAALARRSGFNFPTTFLDRIFQVSTSTLRRSANSVELVEARDADASFDHIFRRYTPNSTLSFVRDREWIRWRYFLAPQFEYRLLFARQDQEPLGYVAYRMQNRGGIIAEIFSPSDHVSAALMRGAIEHLSKLGAESVSTLAVPGTSYDRRCRKMFFLASKSFGVAFLPLATDISREQLSDRNAWNLCGGDFDVA